MAGEMWVCLPGLSFCWDLISPGSWAKKKKHNKNTHKKQNKYKMTFSMLKVFSDAAVL